MKINELDVKTFEQEQKQWGTKIAIENIIILLAMDLMADVDVSSIKLGYRKKGGGK